MFSILLENDDIYDFDLRWEQALLLTNDPPSDKVLEGLYVSKLQDSSQTQTTKQEILRGGGKRDCRRLRMCVKLHIEQAQRSNNFRIQSEITEPCGRQESAFSGRQMGLVQKVTLVVFYICMPRETERQQRKQWRTQEYLASNQP